MSRHTISQRNAFGLNSYHTKHVMKEQAKTAAIALFIVAALILAEYLGAGL